MPRLPSTTALRAFESAARLLNFTQTAAELNLTQGAVSHQIHALENLLSARLFERQARGLTLTEAGRRYLPYAREALERLAAGAAALGAGGRSQVLTVTLSPNFASKWLVPRLGDFLAAHPTLDLRISASRRHVDFAVDDIDLAVRHGVGDWPHLHVTRLCPEWVFPVCSPGYLAAHPIAVPADLAAASLLHDREREHWRQWLAAFGVPLEQPQGPVFSDTSLAIDAAVSGQGVALARSALAALDLAQGRLVRPLAEALPAPFAYWIVCPRGSAERPLIRLFRDWLLQQAAANSERAAAVRPAARRASPPGSRPKARGPRRRARA